MSSNGYQYWLNGKAVLLSDKVRGRFPDFIQSLDFEESRDENACDLRIDYHEGTGLSVHWKKVGEKKPLVYSIDYSCLIMKLRSFPAPKQGAFNQALGNKTKTVLDATGGWGNDAALMATQGYAVTVLERNPLMALLMQEAFTRFERKAVDFGVNVKVPDVNHTDSIDVMSYFSEQVDCAYLDPMFPPKRKKTAAVNKQMQLLQWLVGEDTDAASLVGHAIQSGLRRVAVKRPDYAEPLFKKPSQQFSSKLVHYDVYLQT